MTTTPEETENPHKAQGIRRVINAAGYSIEGMASAFKREAAFRQEVILSAILIPVAAILPVGIVGAALMISSVLLVLIVELLNSAVEWVVDYISLDLHPFAKRAKDMGSAAVFLALTNVALIWTGFIVSNWSAIVQQFGSLFS